MGATIDTVDEVCVRARSPGAPLAARPGWWRTPMRATPKCLGGREVVDRQRLDPVLLRELYQDRRWSSPQIAAHLDSSVNTVLRTLHDHGIPVRRGSGHSPWHRPRRRARAARSARLQVGQAARLHAEGNRQHHHPR